MAIKFSIMTHFKPISGQNFKFLTIQDGGQLLC